MTTVKNMPDELREYRKLCIAIKQLHSYSELEWERAKKERPKRLIQAIEGYEILEDRSIPIDNISLKRLANEHSTVHCIKTKKRHIILPPLDRYDVQYIPTLTLDCCFSKELQSVRYGLFLLEVYQEGGNKILRCLEFRYELDHGGSHHDYSHAQLSRVVENINFDWIPTHTPAFPLTANGAISLLLCMIISLYSKRESGKIVDHLGIDDEYKTPIKQIIN